MKPFDSQGTFSFGAGACTTRNEEGDAKPDQLCVPAPLFRKTEGNGTRHTCVSVLTSAFPLVYSVGLQVGLQTCNVVLTLAVLRFLYFLSPTYPQLFDGFALSVLVTNLLAMAPQPAFDGLQPKSEDPQLFDGFAVSVVTNLLAMAPQPAFDGLQPKREDPQL